MSSSAPKRDGRRTDTRERIHRVALDVFSEYGYERTTQREIAERLGITRAALYYHFTSKDDILRSIHQSLADTIDAVITAARSRPRSTRTRTGLLRELSELLAGPWGQFTRFAQANEAAMLTLTAAAGFHQRIDALAGLLTPKETTEGHLRGRLALTALFMSSGHRRESIGTDRERDVAALRVAEELVR